LRNQKEIKKFLKRLKKLKSCWIWT